MSLGHGASVVKNGLVLYLDAANRKSYPGSDTTWFDLSGNGKNSIMSGTTTDSQGIIFDGAASSTAANLSGLSNLSALTINVWQYSNVSTSTCLINSNPFILHFRGAGFYLRSSDNVSVSNYLAWQSLPLGSVWNMLTGTWDGATMKLYQNGVKQTNELSFTGGSTGQLQPLGSTTVGGYFNVSQPWTNGKISGAMIYNRALSDAEIQQNFNATRGRYGI